MKVVIYDPLYSNVGHFYRYNKFLIELLSEIDNITEIVIIAENESLKNLEEISKKVNVKYLITDMHSMQLKHIQTKGFNKIFLIQKSYSNYKKVINVINKLNFDFVIFASQGQFPFWLSVQSLKVPYIVSAISIKWLYNVTFPKNILHFFYKKYLKKSKFNLFTEDMYKKIADSFQLSKSIVMPDRFLDDKPSAVIYNANIKIIKLITVGTISRNKSPIDFLIQWNKLNNTTLNKFKYSIFGKVMDDSIQEIRNVIMQEKNVEFVNDYISAENYQTIMQEADFMVIPYSSNYTKYVTSGVMWDCFEMKKPIICPDIEPFKYYINRYKIGYLYKEGQLQDTLTDISNESNTFLHQINHNFSKLFEENSYKNLKNKLENVLSTVIIESK